MRSEKGMREVLASASASADWVTLAASSSSWASTSASCSGVSPYLARVSRCHSSFMHFVGLAAQHVQFRSGKRQKSCMSPCTVHLDQDSAIVGTSSQRADNRLQVANDAYVLTR